MIPTDQAIKRILKHHVDSEKYYGHCAAITTEQDLKILFEDLSNYRKELAHNLLAEIDDARTKRFWREESFWSYLHRAWKDVKLALILNNRDKILAYADRAEKDVLKEYHVAGHSEDLPADLAVFFDIQMEEVKRKIEQINAMPRQRFYSHKSVAV